MYLNPTINIFLLFHVWINCSMPIIELLHHIQWKKNVSTFWLVMRQNRLS